MSLYNMLFGVSPSKDILLGLLDLSSDSFGRFRDCYLEKRDEQIVITVHTRCGGGNREDYQEVFEMMSLHPRYLGNDDCDYDSTYADIYFSVPENSVEKIKEMYEALPDEQKLSAKDKWQKILQAMET